MADFDKNLQPIIKSQENLLPESDVRLAGIKDIPMSTSNSGGRTDLAQPRDIFEKLAMATQQSTFQEKGMTISKATLAANTRYDTFNPALADQEDFAAHGQSRLTQAFNGVAKGTSLAATTIAGGFGTAYGLVLKLPFTHRLADIWDNEATRALDELNEKVDNEYLPNYKTNVQKNAEWYSTDNWFTVNWLFDGLIKNAGFAVGAMVGGNIANAGLLKAGSALGKLAASGAVAAEASQAFKLFTPLMRNTARAFSHGKNMESAALLESRLSSIADLTAKSSKMASLSKLTPAFSKFGDGGRRVAMAVYSSGGEASFEALQTAKEYKNSLIEEYKSQNFGEEPTGEELKRIEQLSEKVGKTSFLGNMALLSVTEHLQLPYLIGSSYRPSRKTANALLGKTSEVIKDETGEYIVKAPSKFGKLYKKAGVLRYAFDPKEGGQEIGQYALQVGTQNYFNKSYRGDEADLLVDSALYGFFGRDETGKDVGALVSKEGIEGGIMGAITGGVMQAKKNYKDARAKSSNTTAFLSMLNKAPTFKSAFEEKMQSINRAVALHGEHRDAIITGDKLEALDIKNDLMHTYLAPRIKYGRFDMIMDDLKEMREQGMTEEGLASLKEAGLATIEDTPAQYRARIQKIEDSAKAVESLYQSMNMRYSGMVDPKDPTKRLYSDKVIDKLVYAASKVANYDVRIPQVNASLMSAGINTGEILQSIIKDSVPNSEATSEALAQINEMDVTSDIKDELKTALTDTIELSLRRKMFLNEYEQIKNNPLRYERDEEEVDNLAEVSQKDTTKKMIEVGKEYSLMEPLIDDQGKLLLSPKVTILSKTLGGEFETKLPDGSITFLPEDAFDKYNISDIDNSSQEIEDMLNQAIDDVFDYIPNKNKPKPTGNKLEFVNGLNNPALRKSIVTRFNKLAEDLMKKREELRKAEEALLKNKKIVEDELKEILKKSGELPTLNPTDTEREDTGETGKLKAAWRFFISSITQSEDPKFNSGKTSNPHVIRARTFLNNARKFANRNNLRAIVFTANQEDALGLSGLIRMSYGETQDSPEFQAKIRDENNGFVGMVFVEHDDLTKTSYYVDQEGKRIGKVGEQVDLAQVVFQTMPTTAIEDSQKNDRYRTNEKEEFMANMEAWKIARAKLFKSPTAEEYAFSISRGIPNTEKDANDEFVKSQVGGGHLASDNEIQTTKGLIKVVTKKGVTHQGEILSMPNGVTVIENDDVVEILNNTTFGAKKAKSIFEVMNALTKEMLEMAKSGKVVTVNKQYMAFLQNVMFFKKGEVAYDGRFWIDVDTMTMMIGDKSYSIKDFGSFEKEIIEQLSDTYHSVNNTTLTTYFEDKFYEYYFDGKQLQEREWYNYQTYLLSGEGRSVNETPLVTIVNKSTPGQPNPFVAKYATLQNFNLDAKKVEKKKDTKKTTTPPPKKGDKKDPKPPVREFVYDGSTAIVATVPGIGDVEFTIVKGPDGKGVATLAPTHNNFKLISDMSEEKFAAIKEVAINSGVDSNQKGRQPFALVVIQQMLDRHIAREEEKTPPPPADDVKIKYDGSVNTIELPTIGQVEFTVSVGADGIPIATIIQSPKNVLAISKFPADKIQAVKKIAVLSGQITEQETDSNKIITSYLSLNLTQEAINQLEDQKKTPPLSDIERRRKELGLENVVQVYEPSQSEKYYHVIINGERNQFLAYFDKGRWEVLGKVKDGFVHDRNMTAELAKKHVDKYLPKKLIELFEESNKQNTQEKQRAFEKGEISEYISLYRKEYLEEIIPGEEEYLEFAKSDKYPNKSSQESIIKSQQERIDRLKEELNILKGTIPSTKIPPSKDRKNRDKGFREIGVGGVEKMTARDIELFKQWHADNVPFIPYEILENIITTVDGVKAWGVFENGVAKFYKRSERGTEYHEIFEAIYKAFLSQEERQALLDEFKSRSGTFKDRVSGKHVAYFEATDSQAKERIADDFADFRLGKLPIKTLGERIRRFFKAILDFFKSFVNKPSLKDELFNAINSGKFKTQKIRESVLTETPEYRQILGISESEANEYVQDMVVNISQFLFSEDKSLLYNPSKITGQEIYDHVREIYSEDFEYLSDTQFDSFFQRTVEFFNSLGIRINSEEGVEINEAQATSRNYAPEPFETDWKKNARFAVKFAIATMMQRNKTVAKGSLNVPNPKLSPLVKGFQLMPFGKTFGDLLRTLSNSTQDEFVTKLIKKAKSDGSYTGLFKRLGGNVSNSTIPFHEFNIEDWRFYVQFFQTFAKQKPTSFIEFTEGQLVYSQESDNFSRVLSQVEEWIESMKRLSRVNTSIVSYDYNKVSYNINIESEKFPKTVPKTPQEQIAFLSELGINFPFPVYEELSRFKQPGQHESDRNQFAEAVQTIYTFIKNNSELGSITTKTLDLNGPYRTLARLYTKAEEVDESNTLMNVNGEMMQKFTENNAVSVFENEFNSAKDIDQVLENMPQLNDIYSTNSVIFKKGGRFFSSDGKRTRGIKVSTIQGMLNRDSDKGKSVAELEIGDRYVLELNQNLKGNYYIMVPADSSTEWMVNIGNEINFKDINTSRGWSNTFKVFRGYLTDEIALALDSNNRKDSQYVNPIAKELRMFKEILPQEMVDQIHTMINEGKNLSEIELYVNLKSEQFEESIRTMLQVDNAKIIKTLRENAKIFPILNQDGQTTGYSYPGLEISTESGIDSKIYDKYKLSEEQLNEIMLFASTNYAIANIELHKMLFGDPYQFKVADGQLDETKRIKSFLSPRRTTFDSVEFNNFLNKELNMVDGVELGVDDLFYHQHKDHTKTVTLSDVNLVTSAYPKVKETDGFSMIMDNTYREVKLKNGEWSNDAERWYQWQMAYTRQALAKKGVYKGYVNNPQLAEKDAALIKTPEPVNFTEVLKPIVSGVKWNQKKVELVLDKFSQMPMFYKAIEGTAMENLYVKMLQAKVGYAVFESGRKVGVRSKHSLYDEQGKFNNTPFAENEIENISWKSYGIQVENSHSDNKHQTRGSQVTKLVSMDMFENGKESVAGASDEYKRNRDLLNEIHNNAYVELLERLGINDNGTSYSTDNKIAVAELLRDEVLKRDPSENIKDSLEIVNGEFVLPLESSTDYRKLKNILYSLIHKSIVSPSMNGTPHVQVPVTLWENAAEGRRLIRKVGTAWEKITRSQYDALSEEDKKGVRLTSDTLKFYTKDSPYMEVMLPNWFKERLIGKGSKFKTDQDLLDFLNKTEEGKKILTGIGFRIPTQSMSSIEVFKVKGFLDPSMGHTVVVPSEITEKSGSDFDIDKLNMYLKSIYLDENDNIKLVRLKGSKNDTIQFYKNTYKKRYEKKLVALMKYANFRDRLLEIYEYADTTEIETKSIEEYKYRMTDEQIEFYEVHQDIILKIEQQAFEKGLTQYDYMLGQIQNNEKSKEKFQEKLEESLIEDYAKNMYKRALENEYVESMEKLIQLKDNFERLMSPVGDAGLKDVGNDIRSLMGENESSIKNKLISRSYMTSLRHAFVSGKKWVGIAAVNITGHSLAQKTGLYLDPRRFENASDYDRKFLGDMNTFLPHNKVIVDGNEAISLGGRTSIDGDFISDRLSGYATSFVDVAKDPFIMSIVRSNLVVGTALFMERIGVGKITPYFLNQPIIVEYLNYLSSIGGKGLFSASAIDMMYDKFPIDTDITIEKADVKLSTLKENIKRYADKDVSKYMSIEFNEQQLVIFHEFLKMAKMAQHLFKFSQAYNYDTTKFKNSDSFARKVTRTESAKTGNIISSIDNLLDQTFIGTQKEFINKTMRAMGAIIKLENDDFSYITDEVLREYREDEYLAEDDFDRISDKVKASFLDFIIHTKSSLHSEVAKLTTGKNALANQLETIQSKYPNMTLLRDLVVESSRRPGGAATIKLRVKPENSLEINLYIGTMRELRTLEPEFYDNLVTLSIIQGTYPSRVSIAQIIPIEDYAAKISPIINGLRKSSDLDVFYKNAMFQRQNWKDDDVVPPIVNFALWEDRQMQGQPLRTDEFGNEYYLYTTPMFGTIPGVGKKSRQILLLNPQYNLSDEVVKLPRVIERRYKGRPTGELVDIVTLTTVQKSVIKSERRKGNFTYDVVYGYKKVRYSDGSPVVTKSGEHVYKRINLYGDGALASEYKTDGSNSAFRNGSVPVGVKLEDGSVREELNDAKIIEVYGGEKVSSVAEVPQIISTPKGNVEVTDQIIPRSKVRATPKTMYLFGDNDKRTGLGGQAKEMRNEKNTFGISTKKQPTLSESAYKSDAELEQNKKIITADINKVIVAWDTGKYDNLVIPQIGVGLAELPTRAPETYAFLQEELARLIDHVSGTSASPVVDPVLPVEKSEQPSSKSTGDEQKIQKDYREEVFEKAFEIAFEYISNADSHYYLELPEGLSQSQMDEISGVLFDGTNDELKEEYEKKYVRKIRTIEDFEKAKEVVKTYDWAFFNDYGEATPESFKEQLEDLATAIQLPNGSSLEGFDMESLLKDYQLGRFDPEEVEFAKEKLVELGLDRLIDYNPNQLSLFVDPRIINVNQYKIQILPSGKMFFDNGNEVTDQTIKNKVNIRKELQDKTLRVSTYNKSEYFVLSDNRIVGSGTTNLGKETVTDPDIKKKILMKAVLYKKSC